GDEVSVVGADWTADGRLVFASDETGWWNLRSWRPGSDEVTSLTELVGAEIGFPQWVFGLQSWVEVGDQLAVVITRDGADELALLDAEGTITGLDAGAALEGVSWVQSMTGGRGFLDVIVHHGDRLPSIVQIDLTAETPGSTGHAHPATVLRAPNDLGVDAAWFSRAEAITFGGAGAAPGDDPSAHAFFYPPTGAGCAAPDGELPPLVVMGHGGPTAHSAPSLSLKVQYWTSRGFAVVDVNYGGSSGFGRAYRNRLRDAWGIVDVADCIAAARSLAEAGRVDPNRIVIRGGSAGGFTVLRALQESDLFAAGTSLYGVADLTALAEETHKFESRYL
ncbi:MAG: prolyl oligopeptidase family serine peptidase, partial [Acidimicrobiales bacterium]